MQGITIVGPGRMGGALALALVGGKFKIDAILYRTRRNASRLASKLSPRPKLGTISNTGGIQSPIVLITTQDGDILSVARDLVGKLAPSAAVFHTSGSLSSEVLDPLREAGYCTASLHPLASISTPESGAERFNGAYFCLEGDEKAVRIGKRLVRHLGGHPFQIDPSAKTLYHAAAVTAAGHVTALFDISVSLMTRTGLDRRQSRKILQPLLAGAAANLAPQDTVDALTGTFARADVATFERQIGALKSSATKSEFLVYLELALRSLDLAEKRGADTANIAKMRRMISLAKRSIE